jgi:hypothetical protein
MCRPTSDEQCRDIDSQEDPMLYADPEYLKAEHAYRRDRIAREFRTSKRSGQRRNDEPKPARHRSPLSLRHA